MTLDLEAIDGCVGEAWSGDVPDGSHINVVLARRGSATAAAAADGAGPARGPGHAPLVVCLGAGNAVRPVTIMVNKAHGDRAAARADHLGRGAAGRSARA